MNLNPYQSALLAALYIIVIVSVLQLLSSVGQGGDGEDTIFIPMAMLSLFVLSAAVMGFLFGFRPVALFLEGKKQEAVTFFFKTVATFAVCALGFVLGYLYLATATVY